MAVLADFKFTLGERSICGRNSLPEVTETGPDPVWQTLSDRRDKAATQS